MGRFSNSMVKSWILKDLMSRFHITNLPRSYQLTQKIWSLQQGTMSLSDYYTALKTLWDDLDGSNCFNTFQNCKCCVATASKAEHAKIVKFLAGLNESYATIRSQIIMKKTIPDLSEIYNLLDQDHSQRTIIPVSSNASAFQVSVQSQDDQYAVNAARVYQNNNPRQNKVQCSHCGYTGHNVDTCYKIHGHLLGFKHKKQSGNNF
ncbi:hypothetical protein V5N11_027574 [Cardamine amara subsp. amara]|uniref:Retrotransposon gag domain-containing protein n=1 Tax=Cardamine amara subsp. amara TaxID=228776 RepID=A0ABD0ZJF6_CARAN